MKVTVLIVIALLAFCLSANGWWGGRRSSRSTSSSRSSRRSSSSSSQRRWIFSRPRKPDGSSSSTKDKDKSHSPPGDTKGNDESAGDTKDNGKTSKSQTEVQVGGEVKIKTNSFEGILSGTIIFSKSKTESKRQRRSTQWSGNHYNITLKVDPCNFHTYDDLDRDGTIDKDELHAIFGSNELADALFADLDQMDDGIVTEEEFNDMAPVVISECIDTKK